MLIRTALAAALVFAVSPLAHAEPATSADYAHIGVQAVAHVRIEQNLVMPRSDVSQGGQGYVLIPAPDPLGDIVSGRGPDEDAAGLARFAVYASNGNRAGMEIVSAQLRQFGATHEDVQDFADRAALHTGSIPRQDRTD